MKSTIKTEYNAKWILIGIYVLISNALFANIYPISLQHRIDSAEQIVIGKVIAENSYWEVDSTNIYTAYTMEVICYAKNADDVFYFDLLLPGGTVGEDIQIDYPYIKLQVGYEYMVAVEEITLYQLNRKHARSSGPKFQPYSYIQGILPMHNGSYQDYNDTVEISEADMLQTIFDQVNTPPMKPTGAPWTPRTVFNMSDGDIDNDGVPDMYDLDPNDPNSDSDRDLISDIEESTGNASGTISDPMNACDPYQTAPCMGVDMDGDGYYGNYPPSTAEHDAEDENNCVPNNAITNNCNPEDIDNDGFIGNVDPSDPNYDLDDLNPCIPLDQEIFPSIADSYIADIYNAFVDENFGDYTILTIGENPAIGSMRGIFKFDLSMHQGKPVKDVLLKLHVKNPQNITYQLEVFNAIDSWDENTATWNNAQANSPWSNGPGEGFDQGPIGTLTASDNDWIYIHLDRDIVDTWLTSPETNHGIFIKNFTPLVPLLVNSIESEYPPTLEVFFDVQGCQNSFPRAAAIPNNSMVLKNGAGTLTNEFYAGTILPEYEMIIEGSGFSNSVGQILLPNADVGGLGFSPIEIGTDLVHWTDTEIRFKIPKTAGTGTMKIATIDGTPIGNVDIKIMWALNPIYHDNQSLPEAVRQRVHFVDVNTSGGYTLQVNTSTGFASNSAAVAALERAISKWQCSSDVNWVLDVSGTSTEATKDGFCIAHFSTDLPAGVLAIATSRFKAKKNSSCPHYNAMWRLSEFDIAFADPSILPSGFGWNFSEEDPSAFEYDFESIALHELGHAHGLAHVIDESSVMHYSITNGETKRSLSQHELEGAAHKMEYSVSESCVSSVNEMIAFNGCDLESPPENYTKIKVFLEGYFNDISGTMSTELASKNLLSLTQPFNTTPFNYIGTESVTSFPDDVVDWILVELRDPNNMDLIITQKAFLLRKDGMLIGLDGSEELYFTATSAENYYLALYHTNHLAILSSTPHPVQQMSTVYDFTNTATATMGSAQTKDKGGHYVMNSGDLDGNGIINNEDYNLWKTSGATINTYSSADADGNGIINSLDYNFWKVNRSKIGLITR